MEHGVDESQTDSGQNDISHYYVGPSARGEPCNYDALMVSISINQIVIYRSTSYRNKPSC